MDNQATYDFVVNYKYISIQGGRKFEISWDPNFPISNFAWNNENKSDIKLWQICVIFLLKSQQRCVIFTQYQME